VLSDLTMPRMNGWDTLAALRKLSPDIPVILSSGYDEAQVMAGEHLEQPNAFLGKPYRLQELKDTVHRALAGKGKSITHGHNAEQTGPQQKETGECHNDQ
jgi:DNA-binding NtrC family response regulator